MIKKYKDFLTARLDLYKEMYERGFQKERLSKMLKDFEASLKRHNLLASKVFYPYGVYPFLSFEEAQKDLEERVKKYDNP
ncbi:MAG: hypothetical protein AB1630_02080 [bacterium]